MKFASAVSAIPGALALMVLLALPLQGCSSSPQEPTPDAGLPSTDAGTGETDAGIVPPLLTEEQFALATRIYFDRCAGCHGTLRTGATGPSLLPPKMKQMGTANLKVLLTHGTGGGMPPYADILSAEEIDAQARFLQMEPPSPPQRPLAEIMQSWNLLVPVAERPTAPVTTRDWDNFIGVILRDAGKVAIMDGTTRELVKVLDTGFAVHILRASGDGRYFLSVGRDGLVTMIDLWPEEPTTVATVQGCSDARSVDTSKFPGYEGRYVIEGCFWPAQYVIFDGQTLEPLQVVPVPMTVLDTDEVLTENRVAAIVASHADPVWVANLKESGHVVVIDYSKPGFPITTAISSARFLHDGGLDRTGRYFMTAANMSNAMVVVDVQEQKLEAIFETGNKPHPGRGANWDHPVHGPVNATPHLGEGKLAIYGTDPAGRPENAWKVVQNVAIPTGGLFVKTHHTSPWVWMDATVNADPEKARSVCVYSKADAALDRCWKVADKGTAVHFEYNKQGTEIWVSVWDKEGELVVYDAQTLEELDRITGDWLVTPTGKFNVHNTRLDVY
jgi:nitrite reductase (NO-forming) / hydroxylamine reductase